MFKKTVLFSLLIAFVLVPPAFAQKVISIGTAPAGGAWYGIGGALADIITKNVAGVTAVAEVTGAAIENVKLLGTKKIEMGFTISDIAKRGYDGKPPFTEKYPNIRTFVSSIQKGSLQIVALKGSGLEHVSDLKGKRVAVGPSGHGSLKNLQEIFGVLGFTFDDIKPVYLPYDQSLTALGDKKVDAAVIYAAPPAPAIKEFGVTHEITLLALTEQNRKKVVEKYPNYVPDSIPKGVYRGIENDVPTVSSVNLIMIRAALDDELVYKITKALFDNIDRFRMSHPSAKGFSLKVATKGSLVPFHPGAIRYYKEQGVWSEK
jgi:TRAP transporter TAXI family solute receptor